MPAALLLALANHHQWQHMKPVRLRCAASDGCVCVYRCELSRQRLVLKPHQYHKFYSMETMMSMTRGEGGGECVFFLSFSCRFVCQLCAAVSRSRPLPPRASLGHPLEARPRPGELTTLSTFICMQICCFSELDSLGALSARCH